MAMQINFLLQKFFERGYLSKEHLPRLEKTLKNINTSSVVYLTENFSLSATQIAEVMAEAYGFKHIDKQQLLPQEIPVHLATDTMLEKNLLPIREENDILYIAVADPEAISYLSELNFQIKHTVRPLIAEHDHLIILINHILTARILKNLNENLIIAFVEQILSDAIHRGVSDIHFESYQKFYRIRFRIDGILQIIAECPNQLAQAINSRLKILAELDIAEKRLPQDGRFTHQTKHGKLRDCRVSTCPTLFGEKIVVRVLNKDASLLNMTELGLNERQSAVFLKTLQQPQGLILVTGPTGCGKTLTLYAAMQHLNHPEKNIISIEDPIEIQLNGVNQIQVHPKINLDFSHALRAILRQDPDIIMVGEIRDLETANMAMRAAQTGHLVLATLHTNNATETFIRLLNMGVPAMMLAHSVLLIIAQRLVRSTCLICRNSKQCAFCVNGYKGRTGIFELLPMPAMIRQQLLQTTDTTWISRLKQKLMNDLWQAGLEKVESGITDLNEIYRVLGGPVDEFSKQ
jgi:type IV pilus assembly protein PilB